MAASNSTPPVLSEKQIEIFWSRVERKGPGECWPWKASRDRKGYGTVCFTLGRRIYLKTRSHILARFLATGEWPNGLLTCHTCDNPCCANPEHLYLGKPVQNTRDMMTRKRHRYQTQPDNVQRGEELTQSKLSGDKVREIRRLYAEGGVTLQDLAARYGVTKVCVHHVIIRKTWKHID